MKRLKLFANDLTISNFFLDDLGRTQVTFWRLLDLALQYQLGGLLMVDGIDDDDLLELFAEDGDGDNSSISVFFDSSLFSLSVFRFNKLLFF